MKPFIPSDRYLILIRELVKLAAKEGFRIIGVRGIDDFPDPPSFQNDGYGDQEDKTPDFLGMDEEQQQFVFGLVKTGEDDLESEHALTQYNVFLDQYDAVRNTRARLIIVLPSARVADFNTLITHYIHPDYWPNLTLVGSDSPEA